MTSTSAMEQLNTLTSASRRNVTFSCYKKTTIATSLLRAWCRKRLSGVNMLKKSTTKRAKISTLRRPITIIWSWSRTKFLFWTTEIPNNRKGKTSFSRLRLMKNVYNSRMRSPIQMLKSKSSESCLKKWLICTSEPPTRWCATSITLSALRSRRRR